jgi:hypothetical protein
MWEWYLFALFVFVLGCLWLLIYKREKNRNNPDVKLFKEREEKIFRLYQNIEDLMDGFEEYVEEMKLELFREIKEVRVELSQEKESVLAIAKESVSQSKLVVPAKAPKNSKTSKSSKASKSDTMDSASLPQVDGKSGRIDKVNELIDKGLSVDDIARKLNMGKGEVKLIYQIHKNNTKV